MTATPNEPSEGPDADEPVTPNAPGADPDGLPERDPETMGTGS